MRILDRYILKSVLHMFLVCLFTFLFLYIVIDIFSYLEDILKQQVDFYTIVRYYLIYFPYIFVQVSPFSCLLATLYTFARLNRDNEIIAMRASGLSVFNITKTVIIFGFITSVLIFWVSDKYVPRALALNQKIKYQMDSANKKNKASQSQDKQKSGKDAEKDNVNNLSMYGLGNRLFFVNKFSPKINTMENIIILEQDEHQNVTKKVVANKGVYKDRQWVFYQCITYDYDTNGQVLQEPKYSEEEIMPIPETPQEFLSQKQSPDLMNIAQINDYIWKLSKSGANTVVRNLKVDLYQRYTSALICLAVTLLGIPFSLKMRRRATGVSSLGISIMLAFLYYVLNAVSIALGKSGILTPILAASLSHMLAIGSSIYLILSLP